MKEIKKVNKNSFLKKLFIKICRFLNYEIIDQSNFALPVTNQKLDEDLSIVGKSPKIPIEPVIVSCEAQISSAAADIQ